MSFQDPHPAGILPRHPESLTFHRRPQLLRFLAQCLHLFCRPGAFTTATLAAAVAARGVTVRSIAPVAPTLEDAFVRLAQRKDERP